MPATEGNALGVLKIEIAEPASSLALTFEVSEDGDEWNPERLANALKERGIASPPPAERLQAFLAAAVAAKTAHREVLIEGVAPQNQTADRVTWNEDLAIPDELGELVPAVLANARAPEITEEIKEKVERQKEVERKGKFPFSQSKVEVVTVSETVTRREKVYVDPTVERSFFVETGTRLGAIVAGELGIPGKDIFGRALPARKLADPLFHVGAGITRTGEELTASRTGILRIGKNWADIVPFARHRWRVDLSTDRATCYLHLEPGNAEVPPPSPDEIIGAARELDYPEESLISADEIAKAIADHIAAGQPAEIPLSGSRDASFDIVVSEDKLSALLYIHKGKGRGKPLNLKEVGAAIKASGLRGLDFKKISADISAFYQGSEFDLTGYPLAEGTAPTTGPERAIELSVRFDKPERTAEIKERLAAAAPEEQPESIELFPAEAITATATVEAEQLIATRDPETPGESGMDVYGAVLPGSSGPGPEVHIHENLVEKNHVIFSSQPGVLDVSSRDGVYHFRVRAHVDAQATVIVAADGTSATLALSEGTGTGSRLNREMIDAALDREKVVFGIKEEIIARALEAAKAGTPVDGIEIAAATPPIDQSENQIEVLVGTSDEPAVRIRKDGTADYRTRDTIVTVTANQELCRILPSQQEPVDGTNVRGEPIPARQVGGAQLDLGENVSREDRDDGSAVIRALVDGEFIFQKGRMEVRTAHTIKGDVDMTVGNVKFPGTVTIGGTVRSGFYVMSGGDILIGGGVEGALLSADGDIKIKQGVKGAGKAVLRSKRSLMSPFVELATVLTVGDVILKSALVRSRIKTNGKIAFQGDKGRIVGGIIRARDGMEATSVGSPRGVRTRISFGQDYLIADLIEKEEHEIEKVKTRITQVDLAMRKSEKAKATEQLTTLRKEKVKLLKLMEKRGLRLFTLRERFEQHFPSKIVIHGDVHTGTVFESHGRTYEITKPRKGVVVEFDPSTGNLDINDLNGSDQ